MRKALAAVALLLLVCPVSAHVAFAKAEQSTSDRTAHKAARNSLAASSFIAKLTVSSAAVHSIDKFTFQSPDRQLYESGDGTSPNTVTDGRIVYVQSSGPQDPWTRIVNPKSGTTLASVLPIALVERTNGFKRWGNGFRTRLARQSGLFAGRGDEYLTLGLKQGLVAFVRLEKRRRNSVDESFLFDYSDYDSAPPVTTPPRSTSSSL
jgi:hypothetical protein